MLDDIRKAFSNFESSNDHSERVKFFQDALNQAKTILESNVPQIEKDKINDLKYIYTRKLLEQIGPACGLTFPEEHWIYYLKFLHIDCRKEVDKIFSENIKLKENYKTFFESVSDDIEAIKRMLQY